MSHLLALTFLARYGLVRIPRAPVRLCSSYSPSVSVWTTCNPTRARSRARIVTWPNWSVPVNGEIVWKCRIGLFEMRAICSWMREVVLKLTMDYEMTKHMLNNCTLNESRTWLLVRTWHCYFISFNSEHPVDSLRFDFLTLRYFVSELLAGGWLWFSGVLGPWLQNCYLSLFFHYKTGMFPLTRAWPGSQPNAIDRGGGGV